MECSKTYPQSFSLIKIASNRKSNKENGRERNRENYGKVIKWKLHSLLTAAMAFAKHLSLRKKMHKSFFFYGELFQRVCSVNIDGKKSAQKYIKFPFK